MGVDKVFGLPAHPLLVHVPVMLIPLVAIGAVWIALSPTWRARIGWVVVVLAGVAVVGAQLAATSGEELAEALEHAGEEPSATLEQHTEMGETFLWFALLLFVAVLGLMLWDRRVRKADPDAVTKRTPIATALAVFVIVVSVAAGARVYQVGHSGAKAVWEEDANTLVFDGGEGTENESNEGGEGGG